MRKFKYLGSALTEDNIITTEMKETIVIVNQTSYGLAMCKDTD
jgi:hypothetical protein